MSIFVAAMFNLSGKKQVTKDFNNISKKIYPVIKVMSDSNDIEDIINLKKDMEPIFRKITDNILCFYGIDRGEYYELLKNKDLPDPMSVEDLDRIAKENLLSKIESNLLVHKTDFGGYGLTCGEEHEAALLILPEIWNIITENVGNSIVFCIPSADIFVFANSDSNAGVEGVRNTIEMIYNNGEKILSRDLFKYENGKIDLFEYSNY